MVPFARRFLSSGTSVSHNRRLVVYDLSSKLTDYEEAWRYQLALVDNAFERRKTRIDNEEHDYDAILLVQHPSIYTLGRGASLKNIKFDVPNDKINSECNKTREHKSRVIRIERGGEVTWHGPGQLVAYPILDLNFHKKDLHWYTHCLEDSVIRTAATFGVNGSRSDVNTGVWVGLQKLCAIGVSATRWITYHGMAFNINCDLENFNLIVPCGISDPTRGVCSMASVSNSSSSHPTSGITIGATVPRLVESFTQVFSLRAHYHMDAQNHLMQLTNMYPNSDKSFLPLY